jgi:hypothetical protein
MGAFQSWLMLLAYIATAPPLALRNHASAKHVMLTKFPFTQATSMMKGVLVPLVNAVALVLLNPVVTQEVSEPCPT